MVSQRVIGDGINSFDDVGVILERVVNKDASSGFVLFQVVLNQIHSRLRKMHVQRNPVVRVLSHSDLIYFVRREKVPIRSLAGQNEDTSPYEKRREHLHFFMAPS